MIDTSTKLSMLQERYKSKAEAEYVKALDSALSTIIEKIRKTESDAMRRRLIIIHSMIEKELGAINGTVIPAMQEDMQGFAEISHEAMFTALNASTGVGYAFAALPSSTIKEIIDLKRIQLVGDKGYTLEDMFNTVEQSQIDRYKQIINAGLAGNIGYAEIAKNLTAANETGMVNIKAIVHTSIASARDIADSKAYEAFDSVITGWKSISVLDSRTSLLCASMDGKRYMKPKFKYVTIPNRPPRHFRCRSSIVPLTKFSEELSGTRAQNGDTKGQISAKTNFSKWFDSQSEKFQRDYLGQARFDLYKSGKFQIKDFVDIKNGERFTLDQLRKMI